MTRAFYIRSDPENLNLGILCNSWTRQMQLITHRTYMVILTRVIHGGRRGIASENVRAIIMCVSSNGAKRHYTECSGAIDQTMSRSCREFPMLKESGV